MAGKNIVFWKTEDIGWNTKTYIEEHPEYKKTADMPFYVWETVLYTAEEMGLTYYDMDFLFEEKPDIAIVDLLFGMFLIRLFGQERAKDFLNSKKQMTFPDVHFLLRDHEGFLIDEDLEKKNKIDQSKAENKKKQEKAFDEMADSLRQEQTSHEQALSIIEQMPKIIEAAAKKMKEEFAPKHEQEQPQPQPKEEVKTAEDLKQIQKLEVDNLVLRYQLDHKEEVTKLRSQFSEKEKALELKEKELEEFKQKYEELKKKDDKRHSELTQLIKAYQVAIESNTQELRNMLPFTLFRKKTAEKK